MKSKVTTMIDEVSAVVAQIPEITHLGDPVLRTKCSPVTLEEGQATGQKLTEILRKYRALTGIGVGLAAPQIGIPDQVFVTYDKAGDTYHTFINPRLVGHSDETNYFRESCLSSRMMWADVERPVSITLSWTDMEGKNHQEEFTGSNARLLQHEYDHLLGIPCLDRAIVGTIEYSGDVKQEVIRNHE